MTIVGTRVRAVAMRLVSRALFAAPRRVQIALAGGPPPAIDGNTLDLQTHLALALNRKLGKPTLDSLDPVRARAFASRSMAPFEPPTRPMARVQDLVAGSPGVAGGVPVRVYTPRSTQLGGPCLVWFHGGGAVIGSVDDSDATCRLIADAAACAVVSVEYRLAPEHPFPDAVDDALAGYLWTRANAAALDVDPARIAVGGDSMGGNLAAVVCQQAAARGEPLPAFQLLVYPVTDWRFQSRSHELFADGFLLTRSLMRWFRAHYLGAAGTPDAAGVAGEPSPALLSDTRTSPLRAESVAGQPPAYVITAGFDPLRDEGRAYADRLRAAGVRVEYRCFESLIHGFVSVSGAIAGARAAAREMTAALRGAW